MEVLFLLQMLSQIEPINIVADPIASLPEDCRVAAMAFRKSNLEVPRQGFSSPIEHIGACLFLRNQYSSSPKTLVHAACPTLRTVLQCSMQVRATAVMAPKLVAPPSENNGLS